MKKTMPSASIFTSDGNRTNISYEGFAHCASGAEIKLHSDVANAPLYADVK